MASPRIVVFFIFNPSTGAPVTGQASSMSFVTYKDDLGTDISQPVITEIGGGGYKFTPTYTPGRGICYILNTGTGANPPGISEYLRPEDYNIDNLDVPTSTLATASAVSGIATAVTLLQKIETGKWAVIGSGADANKLVIYDTDGTTPLLKFALADVSGTPTTTNPFIRTPTS